MKDFNFLLNIKSLNIDILLNSFEYLEILEFADNDIIKHLIKILNEHSDRFILDIFIYRDIDIILYFYKKIKIENLFYNKLINRLCMNEEKITFLILKDIIKYDNYDKILKNCNFNIIKFLIKNKKDSLDKYKTVHDNNFLCQLVEYSFNNVYKILKLMYKKKYDVEEFLKFYNYKSYNFIYILADNKLDYYESFYLICKLIQDNKNDLLNILSNVFCQHEKTYDLLFLLLVKENYNNLKIPTKINNNKLYLKSDEFIIILNKLGILKEYFEHNKIITKISKIINDESLILKLKKI